MCRVYTDRTSISQVTVIIAHCRLYQCNVCGEGGEYESLVLDCPLFKHARIALDKWDIVMQSPDSFAPVGLLHPVAFHLECKAVALTAPAADIEAQALGQVDSKSTSVPDGESTQTTPGSTTSRARADEQLTGAVVIEVPEDLSVSTSTALQSSADGGLSSQSGVAAWQTDVQLHCNRDYARAVCCPQQQSARLVNAETTAEGLAAALAAVSQGMYLLCSSSDGLLFQAQSCAVLLFVAACWQCGFSSFCCLPSLLLQCCRTGCHGSDSSHSIVCAPLLGGHEPLCSSQCSLLSPLSHCQPFSQGLCGSHAATGLPSHG